MKQVYRKKLILKEINIYQTHLVYDFLKAVQNENGEYHG